MIKKLKTYICLAAVLLLTTQALMAQAFEAQDPTSGSFDATYSRFTNDVDLFFDVNDWADLEFSKWFGYLRMQNLTTAEGGLALQLSKAYLGLYYFGEFNNGNTDVGTYEFDYDDDGNPVITAPNFSGFWNGAGIEGLDDIDNGITRANYYGVLLGLGNHGLKFTVLDTLTKVDLPFVYAATPIAADPGGPNKQDIPGNTLGSFTRRQGAITPRLQWGAASDMTFGKYSTRPSASLALAVTFDDYEFADLKTLSGDTLDNIQDYSGNSFTPTIGVDTGSIKFWSGDWGTLFFGASEDFSFKINGEGNGKTREYAEKDSSGEDSVPWENKLMPYAIFKYQANEYFALGAKLTVPVWLGWDGSDGTYFGVGAKGAGVSGNMYDALNPENSLDRPLLQTGFQLKGSVFNKLAERHGILDKFIFNWGIKVNLPGYLYDGAYEFESKNSDEALVSIEKSGNHYWINASANRFLNEVTGGFTFFITPNALIDVSLGKDFLSEDNAGFGRILISVKHNGPKKAASAATPAAANNTEAAE